MGCCGWVGRTDPPTVRRRRVPARELIGRHRSQAAVELTPAAAPEVAPCAVLTASPG